MVKDVGEDALKKITKGIDDCASKRKPLITSKNEIVLSKILKCSILFTKLDTDKLSTDDKCKSYTEIGKCFMKNMWTVSVKITNLIKIRCSNQSLIYTYVY